jgi:hypothetical protein
LRTVLWQWADQPLNGDEIEQLVKLEKSVNAKRDELLDLITINEFNALVARINRLLSEGKFPAPSDEWPSVPWPPF